MCLIEAQSHGVVPISMDMCEGVRSIVGTDGSAGILTPKGDVQAFADKMLEFAALDEDKSSDSAIRWWRSRLNTVLM